MKYNTTVRKLSVIKADCVCLPVFENSHFSENEQELDSALNGALKTLIKQIDFKGNAGVASLSTLQNANFKNVILMGLGKKDDLSLSTFQKAANKTADLLKQNNIKTAVFANTDLQLQACAQSETDTSSVFIQAVASKRYSFDKYKSTKNTSTLSQLSIQTNKASQNACKQGLEHGQALSMGMSKARDLGNEPGNVCTPTYLASEAKALVAANKEMSLKVLEEKDMQKLDMGAFLSVSKGSIEPGKLIIIDYKGGKKNDAPHVLLGKGITFDTGGISLKPGAQMDEMKYDMCGAASVIGVMTAIAELKPNKNIIGVIAAAENMPAGNASKPGDIVTTASGQTVEILNTDAEGRLVLCDALTYIERFKPASVVDIATLTGACIVALGHHRSGLMSNNDELANLLLTAGKQAGDQAWQLPIGPEYDEQINSPFADMQNIGGKGAGTITAACFLARFAKQFPWAHLDIAGTAWVSGGMNKGATGRPVPLLLNYLLKHAS